MGYDYSKNPAPEGYCPVCWHRHGRAASEIACDRHSPDEKEFYRLKELQSREGRS